MIRYNTPLYSHDDEFNSCCGERVIDKFVLDFPDRGGVCLKKCGEIPLYDMIQANRVNCDFAAVMENIVKNDPTSVLDVNSLNDVVADFTTVTNLGELYSSTKRIENAFYDLPLEVRQEFNSDLKQFVRSIGTDDFNSKVEAGYAKFNGTYHSDLLTNKPIDPVLPVDPTDPVTPVTPVNPVEPIKEDK